MPHADADGAKIYYDVHGAGTPLLLVSGFGSNATVYWANIPRLAERFRVIAMDPRGSGRSDVAPGPYTMAMLAGDCAAVLDANAVETAHVLGTSMGGMIAQNFAVLYPERLRRLVLACTTPGGTHHVLPPAEQLAVFMGAAEIADAAAAVRATYPLHYSDAYAAVHDEEIVARSRANEHLRSTPEGRAAQLAAVQGHNTWDALTAITAPTLVLHGERDGIVRVENGRNIAARIPGARLRTWTEGRHLFFVEFADELNEEVIGFLDEDDAVIAAAAAGRIQQEGE